MVQIPHRSIWFSSAPRSFVRAAVLACVALLSGLASFAPAFASSYEPTTELPMGSLAFASNGMVAIEREDVVIGIDKVRLSFLLRNVTARDIILPMAFSLPDIDMLELDGAAVAVPAYDNQNPTNFLGFWTMIDGKAVSPTVNARALVLGVSDVTRVLGESDLPLYPFAPEMADKISQLKPDVRANLIGRGVLNGMVDPPAPAWTLRTGFHWPVAIAADKSTTIQHGYKPILGSDAWSAELSVDLAERYCIPAEVVSRLNARLEAGDAPIVYWMSYEPGAKSHMKGRAAVFNLTLEKPSEQGAVATCFRGLKQGASAAIEWSARDYHQSDDIHILFVE